VDPVSALVIAFIVGTAIMRSAGQAAADQARAEVSRAADAVRADLRGRRTAAAARLGARLEAGRAAGPVYPMWWAWAGVRAAGALRRAARQRRRTAERRPGPARATTGPLGRILGAALRGGVYGWRESLRQLREYWGNAPDPVGRPDPQGQPDPQGRPRPVPVGVCERCGAAAALAALAYAETRHGRRARMCARCRAEVDIERRLDAEPDPAPAAGPADVVDAELVDQPAEVPAAGLPAAAPACVRCGEQLVAFGCGNPECPLCPAYRGPLAVAGAPDPTQFRLPVRFCVDCRTQMVPSTWWARSADNADVCLFCARGSGGRPGRYPDGACRERTLAELAAVGTPLDARGESAAMSPAGWAQLGAEAALRAFTAAPEAAAADDSRPDPPAGPHDQAAAPAAPPAALPAGDDMSCNGELHTQADWADQSAGILGQLDGIVASSENMLKCLTAKEASRSQMTAASAWADQVAAVAARGRELVGEVNARQDPYVDAVQGAGGSEEVAVPDYYAEL
jgi:hypothetical protein